MKFQLIPHFRKYWILTFLIVPSVFAQSLLWPTDASYLLTSSFGEYRSGHFHAGIDIKTWGKEGYQVFAVGAGSVVRLRVSPYNYGKAVYFKLDNGLMIVFGHLSDFSLKLRPFVEEAQRKNNQYQVDLSFPEGMIPFQAGEILAFSGGTGTGAPHLHMEVRDQNNCPVNPLFLGYPVKDNLPPVLRSLAIRPLSSESRINGDVQTVLLPVCQLSENHYMLKDTVSCRGDAGFSLSCYDQANGASNKLSVYKISMFVDDHPLYATQYDRIPFDVMSQVDLDRDYFLRKQGRGTYQKLYRDHGNSLAISWPAHSNAGVVHCESAGNDALNDSCELIFQNGLHRLMILASDYAGNETRLTGYFNVEENPDIPQATYETVLSDTFEIKKEFTGLWIRFEMRLPFEPSKSPNVWIWPTVSTPIRLDFSPMSSGYYTAVIPAQNLQSGLNVLDYTFLDISDQEQMLKENIHLFHIPTSGGVLFSEDEKFIVRFPSDGLYSPISGTIETSRNSFQTRYKVVPDILLKRSAEIQLKVAITDSTILNQLGIYSIHENGKFQFVGNKYKEGWLTARVNSLESYQIMQDSVSPEVRWIYPASGSRLQNRNPRLQFCFKDTLSGISAEENYQYFLDNQRLIVAYDPEKDTGTCLLWEPLSYGKHEFLIQIKDRAGNITEETGFFVIK